MLCSASVLNVCAISFDRYVFILSPLRYKALMTMPRAYILLAVLWTVAILSSFVPITNGLHNADLPNFHRPSAWNEYNPLLNILDVNFGKTLPKHFDKSEKTQNSPDCFLNTSINTSSSPNQNQNITDNNFHSSFVNFVEYNSSDFISSLSNTTSTQSTSHINMTLPTGEPERQCVLVVSLPYAVGAGMVTIMCPIILAIFLYFRVSEEARRQAMLVRSLVGPTSVLLGHVPPARTSKVAFSRKSSVTLGVIVGAYVVTWTPFLITNVVHAACLCVPPSLFVTTVWLGYCNSLVNPIIYPLLIKDFRKVYRELLSRCCPRWRFLKRKVKVVSLRDFEQSQNGV